MHSRRALLYVPGSDWAKMQKAAGLGADSVCLDLEDGVAPDRKEEARQLVVRALRELDFGRSDRLVRINEAASNLEIQDLDAVLPFAPDGLVLPKVSNGDQVRAVSSRIALKDEEHKLQMKLLAQIETAAGLVNLKEIASADARLDALIFGAEDFASDIGATRTVSGEEVLYARSAVVAYAAAFGLQAIDMLWTDFKDVEGLTRLAEQGAQLGYSGMQIIHPDQIGPVQRAFTPSAQAIAEAQRVVNAYEQHTRKGKGAFALDGKMVDLPIVKAARRVLARAGIVK